MEYPTKIIYVGDPLCSWCYGYAGELERLKAHFKEIEFQIVVGGLRPYTREEMDPALKRFLRKHWKEVHQRAGVPFSYDILEPETSFVYDTEKPCRAVVVMRHLNPEAEWTFFKRVQQAFYRDNCDTNHIGTYFPLLSEFGVKEADFAALFNADKIIQETRNDFIWCKEVGASSFPTTILQHQNRLWLIAMGYTSADDLIPHTEKLLNQGIEV